MPSLAEATSKLCEDYIIRPESEAGAYARRAILAAIEHYSVERLTFNEKNLALTLSSTNIYSFDQIIQNAVVTHTHYGLVDNWTGLGRPPYSIVTTQYAFVDKILAIDKIDVRDPNGHRYELSPVTLSEITRMRSSIATNGDPSSYCVYGREIWIDSTPSRSLSADVFCHFAFAPVDESLQEESDWFDEGMQLVLARAAKDIFRFRLKDYEAATAMATAEAEELAKLKERGRLLLSSGRLKGSW